MSTDGRRTPAPPESPPPPFEHEDCPSPPSLAPDPDNAGDVAVNTAFASVAVAGDEDGMSEEENDQLLPHLPSTHAIRVVWDQAARVRYRRPGWHLTELEEKRHHHPILNLILQHQQKNSRRAHHHAVVRWARHQRLTMRDQAHKAWYEQHVIHGLSQRDRLERLLSGVEGREREFWVRGMRRGLVEGEEVIEWLEDGRRREERRRKRRERRERKGGKE